MKVFAGDQTAERKYQLTLLIQPLVQKCETGDQQYVQTAS
ncbi:hypothetical protein CHCC14820_2127 [Bacillus paralicheniformis]|jgi:hypothetical protein|nr:hypothetical protein CHCC5027_1531 [Bacillus paralicheniformis]TWJ64890.1 hypothetical protein CHCC5021_0973 [Bacillus paralicheniformis]TWL07131.1 hypothetical protein CHCC19468_3398 [Bacillus paralicheniformis]TWL08645.1 hypothetical protein CHCC19467_4240 [Bacillus paralicheniformis]TWL40483.1 hypothetical protein CHCC15337_1581 [Bacillus paralicheniformis]